MQMPLLLCVKGRSLARDRSANLVQMCLLLRVKRRSLARDRSADWERNVNITEAKGTHHFPLKLACVRRRSLANDKSTD